MRIPFLAGRKKLLREIKGLRNELDVLRSRIDMPAELVLQFASDRTSTEFQAVYDKNDPLVSICIATFNRGDLLLNRTVASLTAQTYSNIEIVIVGDCCTDDTQKLLDSCTDNRVRFENLETRGDYPPAGSRRWMVAGTKPINRALDLASGDFVCHCDDDDEFDLRKVELLVDYIRETRAHFVWHPFFYETSEGKWLKNPAEKLELGSATTSSIFYHNWIKRIRWDPEAWRYNEPGDWNRIRRIKYLEADCRRYDQPLIKHHKEQNQKKT
jgi:glycosyltransferase involved in cell wall biosynthesis